MMSLLVSPLDSQIRLPTNSPDSKVHGANMRPTWAMSVSDGPHDGPMNLAIREGMSSLIVVSCADITEYFKPDIDVFLTKGWMHVKPYLTNGIPHHNNVVISSFWINKTTAYYNTDGQHVWVCERSIPTNKQRHLTTYSCVLYICA